MDGVSRREDRQRFLALVCPRGLPPRISTIGLEGFAKLARLSDSKLVMSASVSKLQFV
jgi:hypothetical protein